MKECKDVGAGDWVVVKNKSFFMSAKYATRSPNSA